MPWCLASGREWYFGVSELSGRKDKAASTPMKYVYFSTDILWTLPRKRCRSTPRKTSATITSASMVGPSEPKGGEGRASQARGEHRSRSIQNQVDPPRDKVKNGAAPSAGTRKVAKRLVKSARS
jgi:hypothetical protein